MVKKGRGECLSTVEHVGNFRLLELQKEGMEVVQFAEQGILFDKAPFLPAVLPD